MKIAVRLQPSDAIRDRVALRCGKKNITFGELDQRSNRLANALLDYGLADEGRLAILCRNSIEFIEAVYGAEKAGLHATIINPTAGFQDIESALKSFNPNIIVANVSSAIDAAKSISGLDVRIFVGDAPGFENYESVLARQSEDAVISRPRGILMPLTSGTTGAPKAVYRRQANVPPYLRQLLAVTAFDPDADIAMASCGLQGSGAYNLAVGLPLKAGVGVIIPDILITNDLDPEEVLRTIETERVTHLYLPNYLMRRLSSLPQRQRGHYDLSSLKCVLQTGSSIPVDMKANMIEWFGPIITEIYAGTEGGGTLITSTEWLQHRGSVGKPAKGLVRIFMDEFEEARAGAVGKVYFHSPRHQRFEYFNNPTATREAYHDDYFTLGDLGYLDDQNYLYLTGRAAEVIDCNGYNVFPAEIDDVLLNHRAVKACATIGIPDFIMGEMVGAVIVLQDGYVANAALTDELLRWCQSKLAMFKCPRRLVYCNDIVGFSQGKVNRKALQVLFETQGLNRATN